VAAGNPPEAPGGSPGPGVDRFGTPVVDPTQNVLDLVNAAIKRQDDLREMQSAHVTQIGQLREDHARYITELRAGYGQELRAAETARIDAIRAVDVGAVNRAAEVSATQATTLATQVATSAEALRGQVEAARQQTATALAAALEPIQKDIQDLRRAQYEAQGQKTQVVESSTSDRDALALETAKIQAQAQRTQVYGVIIAAVVLALALYAAFHK
jgi:hypothetical protein